MTIDNLIKSAKNLYNSDDISEFDFEITCYDETEDVSNAVFKNGDSWSPKQKRWSVIRKNSQ